MSCENDDNNMNEEYEVDKSSFGSRFETFLNKMFLNYGKICSKSPGLYIVPIFALIIACGLSVGIFTNFKAITDPVSLWSAPNSKARIEKNFYDNNFGPFYRVQQVVIYPTNNTPIHYNNETFGPAFNHEFLIDVLEFQNQITNISAELSNKTIVLSDICFQPMKNGKCFVQSPIEWFQSNADLLKKDDYLAHMKLCLNQPVYIDSDTTCLAKYGGPVLPNVALAKFNGKNYKSASAVTISIMINNHVNQKDNEDALFWEESFLNFMKNFTKPSMKIVFYSEVIQFTKLYIEINFFSNFYIEIS